MRNRGLAALVLAAALVLPGALAQAAEKVTIAALAFVSSAPLFIAAEKGYYADEGLDAELKFFQAAQPVAVAVASGDADFGVTGLTAGFYNLAGKGALQIIGAQSREEPGFDFVAYLVSNQAYDSGFTSVDKFPGHSMANTQVGSTFHYMLGRLAEKRGFPLDRVEMKPLQAVPNMIAALKSGQVDSVLLPAHIAKPLAGAGAAHIIGWVHEETPWQLGALFTSTRNVAERRPLVEKFVRAYQRAAADYHAAFNRLQDGKRVFGPEAEALIPAIMKYVPNQTPEKVKDGAPFIDPAGRLDVGDIHRQVAWYKAQGLVDASAEPTSFIDLGFVDGHLNVPGN
jgi:NitT/TauT family transport system substrate-binding protein